MCSAPGVAQSYFVRTGVGGVGNAQSQGSDVAVGAKAVALVNDSAPDAAIIAEELNLNVGDPGVDRSPSCGQEGGGQQGGDIYTQS